MEFATDLRTVMIDGIVETVDGSIFTANEGAEISIVCENPWFRSKANTIVSFNSSISTFEFPFSNESTTENLIEISKISTVDGRTIDYQGEIQTGITITIYVHDPFTKLIIINDLTDELLTIDATYLPQLLDGDIIVITTYSGNKKATLYRNNWTVAINILNAVVYNTDWITIEQGENPIYYQITGDDTAELEISYTNLYSGV